MSEQSHFINEKRKQFNSQFKKVEISEKGKIHVWLDSLRNHSRAIALGTKVLSKVASFLSRQKK